MQVRSVEALEQVVGSRPLGVMMKSLDALDRHCVRLLALSPFAVVGYADAEGRARAMAVGGTPGFAKVAGGTLRITLHQPAAVASNVGCGLLFFIPGLGETLRVNGRGNVEGDTLIVTVEEAFAHCAKALLRSSFWAAPPKEPPPAPVPPLAVSAVQAGPLADPEVLAWIARTPFVVLTSWDAGGLADASPKGDPVGFLRLQGGRLLVPDRPGNRRTDTFHNVIEQPRLAMLALVPGEERALEISAEGSFTTEPALLASMAVAGKTPKIALVLDPKEARLAPAPALAAAKLWDASRHVPAAELPSMAEVFIDHVKQNRQRGAGAAVVRALASKRVMGWALAKDYEKNQY
ncbi:Hypothetical protein CAP_8129 [Chondromyces apiculatus DSM 436]|uniref:Pyridoxamine 5'-phosphate oxidase N-terminal domain-containing protein n=1 Tax=Chondromyces apiculatus DSM 436 TaxID=1192034 RepID=A0A017TEB8_9BACT|nr:Hypothetical protein CAP_8129 [Chondromyces apiculatus DSM 436]